MPADAKSAAGVGPDCGCESYDQTCIASFNELHSCRGSSLRGDNHATLGVDLVTASHIKGYQVCFVPPTSNTRHASERRQGLYYQPACPGMRCRQPLLVSVSGGKTVGVAGP